jgi:hypothetical protein
MDPSIIPYAGVSPAASTHLGEYNLTELTGSPIEDAGMVAPAFSRSALVIRMFLETPFCALTNAIV